MSSAEFVTQEFSDQLTDVYMRANGLRWSLPDQYHTESVVIDHGAVEIRDSYDTIVKVNVTKQMQDDWYARQHRALEGEL